MDITDHEMLGYQNAVKAALNKKPAVTFPEAPAFQDTIHPLLGNLDKKHMQKNLEKFTSF